MKLTTPTTAASGNVPTNMSAARRNLQRLNVIRSIAIGSQFLALYYFGQIENISLPSSLLIATLAVYSALLLLSGIRCRWPQPITEPEFFGHLLLDISFFTALLYLSGGASNPFVSYYLVPISIAAATLSNRYTWSVTLLSVLAYSCLLKFNYPISALAPDIDPHAHHQHGGMSTNKNSGVNLHILGMWANFLISAVLITYFVVQMANELRRQQQRLAAQREDQLRDEQVLAVATLAAGTAHELATPLNTMQILLDEINDDINTPANEDQVSAQLQGDIQTLSQQVSACRATLQQLVATAQLNNSQQSQPQSVTHYFHTLFERWQLMRPDANATINMACDAASVEVYFPPTIAQSLQSLLNNAADASPEKIVVQLNWDNNSVTLTIRDFGPAINPVMATQMGQPFVSSKSDGWGIGLFLSQSALCRFGGTVSIKNAGQPSGAVTQVTLPLRQKVTL